MKKRNKKTPLRVKKRKTYTKSQRAKQETTLWFSYFVLAVPV